MVPGILSRRGLVRRLRRIAASDGFSASRHLLLVTSIDWFAGIRHKNGETASRNLVITAAQAIKRTVEENAVSAYLGDGRFATLLIDQLPAAAKSVAEALAKEFGSREGNSASIPLPTLTSAIVPWRAGDKVDQFLGEALETLDLALHSGGNYIVVHGEFNRELSAWRDEMATGNPFADVVAQDIMEPFPTLLERDTDQSEMAAALRRGGVPVWPYVDGDGRLVGVSVDEAAADEAPFAQAGNPGTVPLAMPDTIPYDASFPEIHEAFSSRGCSTLVVTADDHPLGYLTCDGFLSMIDPIHAESFAGTSKLVDELMYLVVPSKISEASVADLAGG